MIIAAAAEGHRSAPGVMMIAFEVMINDNKPFDAGIDGLGVLSASLWSARREPSSDAEVNQEYPPEELILEVGGLKSARGDELEEHRSWLRKSLKVGDVIVIRIKELNTVDQPGRSEQIIRTLSEKLNDDTSKS